MNEYMVIVERDSVCMGDDIDAPHSYSFKIASTATLKDMFSHLADRHYLASVAGLNHSWHASVGGQRVATIMGNNQYPEPADLLGECIARYAKNGNIDVRFTYNSSTT
jgi:hypothetical protein